MTLAPTERLCDLLQAIPDPNRRDELANTFADTLQDATLEAIVKNMTALHQDPLQPKLTRHEVLGRVSKYVESTLNDSTKAAGHYDPPLVRGQVIYVNFCGIGSEFSDVHYAIVWDVNTKRDHVVIIPTESLKDHKKHYESTFSIGQFVYQSGNLSSVTTVVKLDHMTDMSRKRVERYIHRNPTTGHKEFIFLTEEQEQRIRDGIRTFHLGENTLFSYIANVKRDLPELIDHDVQYEHLLRPFKRISDDNNVLRYCLVEDVNQQNIFEIHWLPTNVPKRQREKYLDKWRYAVAYVDENVTPHIRVSREDAIQHAYQMMLSKRQTAAI